MNKKDKVYIRGTLNMIKNLMDIDIFNIIDNEDDYTNENVYNGVIWSIKKLNKGDK